MTLAPFEALSDLDAAIVTVGHRAYLDDMDRLTGKVRDGGLFIDVKSKFEPAAMRPDLVYWSL